MTGSVNHYKVLGVTEDAPLPVIRAVHRTLMKDLHPDRGGSDLARVQAVNEAWDVLSDPVARKKYDDEIARAAGQQDTGTTSGLPDYDDEGEWGTDVGWVDRPQAPPPPAAVPYPPTAAAGDFAEADPFQLAGMNIFDRQVVDLASMPWYTRDYESRAASTGPWQHVRTLYRRARSWAWTLFAILGVAAAMPLAVSLVDIGSNSAAITPTVQWDVVYVVIFPVLAFLLGRPRARRRRGTVRYVIYVLVMAALAVYLTGNAGITGWFFAAWLLLYVLAVELFRISSTNGPSQPVRRLSRKDVRTYSIWGKPVTDAQMLTQQLLTCLLKLPGCHVFHRLAAPGGQRAVDHAVLCGDRLALIENAYGPGGDFYWLSGHLMQSRPRERPRYFPTSFPEDVAIFRSHFPHLGVRGWLVALQEDGVEVRTNNQHAENGPRVVTADQLLREVGEWLTEGRMRKANRDDLSRLANEFLLRN